MAATSNWFRKLGQKLFSRASRRRQARRQRARRLQLEVLEDRWLPSLVTLASFDNPPGYSGPVYPSSPVVDKSGNLFGTTHSGGTYGYGSVFEVQGGGSTITTLFSFDGSSSIGGFPYDKLAADSSGDLFGITSDGGASQDGTAFELKVGSSTITTLASLNTTLGPDPGLALDMSGNLFGTTETGGESNYGTIFEVKAGSGTITTLASFNGTNGFGGYDDLLVDSSGNLFGCTQLGGPDNYGTVFELAHGSTTITTLAAFDGSDGETPNGLIEDSQGNLFGTTEGTYADPGSPAYFPASQYGTVFEVANGSGSSRTITTLAAFNNNNGAVPLAGVVEDSQGDLFGTTEVGGPEGTGTVFEVAQDSGTITTLAAAAYPQTGLALDESGDLFGTTASGGSSGAGTVFEVPISPAVVDPSNVGLPANAASLTIAGAGFDTNAANDRIAFDNGVTGSVTSATLTSLTVSLSGLTALTAGTTLDASVAVDGVSSGTAVQVATVAPVVSSSNANLPVAATSLTMAGFGFDTNAANDNVSFNNGVTGTVTGARLTSLTVSLSGFSALAAGTVLDASVTVDGVSSGSAVQVATVADSASQLVVTGLPSSATAGVSATVTVTAYDALGNVDTGCTDLVHFTSTDPQAVLPADAALKGGVGTFSVTLETTGTQSVTVMDTGTASVSSTVGDITVTPAAATKFVVAGLNDVVTAGAAGTVTVTAVDAFGNTASGYDGEVHLSSTDPKAVLPADTTLTNGTGTFPVTLETAGPQSVTAAEPTAAAPAALWTGDGNANDATGNNPPATLGGGVSYAAGLGGQAFSFDGATSYVDFGGGVGNFGTADFTVAFWVQTTDASAILLAKRADPSNGSFFDIRLANGVPFVELDGDANGTNYNTFAGTTAIDDRQWHQIAVVRQGPTAYLYIDGVLNASNSTAGTTNISNNADLLAGTYLPGGGYQVPYLAGEMQDISVYNQALSAAEIQSLATSVTTLAAGAAGTTVAPAATSQLVLKSLPAAFTAGVGGTITVTAEDAFGNVTPGYPGTVHITSTDPKAVLPADSTLTGGTGTFAIALETAGTQSITATDTATPAFTATQGGIVVVPLVASQLLLSGVPTTATAGDPFTVTVSAKDAYGNVATSYAGTVHITSSDAQAVLPANLSLSNGVGVFTLTLNIVGTQTLTATDTVNAGIHGSTNGIAVLPVRKLVFTQFPTHGTTGQYLGTVKVAVEDAHGIVMTGDNSDQVTLSGAPFIGIGANTGQSAQKGIVTCTNDLEIDQPGTYTVTAEANGVTSATATITIAKGTPALTATHAGGTFNGSPVPATVTVNGHASLDGVSPILTYYAGSNASGTPLAGAPTDAGTYTVVAALASSVDYTNASVRTTFTIAKAPLRIAAVNLSKVYGAALPALAVTYSGFVNGETDTDLTTRPKVTTTATAHSPVGTYAITVSGAAASNYNIVYVPGTLTVTPAVLTITADNQTKAAGAPLPLLTVHDAGFVNGDTAASLKTLPRATTTATAKSPAGTYSIRVSGAADPDYAIVYVAGTLTIG